MTYSEEEFRKLKAEKERMDAELRMASQIQLSMLPLGRKTLEDVDIFVRWYLPERWEVTCSTMVSKTGSCFSVSVMFVARVLPPPCSWPMPTRIW